MTLSSESPTTSTPSTNVNLDALSSILPVLSTESLVTPMNPPAPATTTIAKAFSNDPRIDALLDKESYRLNHESPLKTPVTVTFSFPSQLPTTYTGENAAGWTPFSTEQQTATRSVLSLLQQQINVTFVEVADTATGFGVMRFSNNSQASSSGYAIMPNSTSTDLDADTWIAIGSDQGLESGGYNWMTLVHEIGHAIGLNHPGNYNAGEASNGTEVGNFLGVNEDAFFNSVMSYRHSAQSIQDTWFMPYDMLTLRYLYGTKAFATQDNVYKYKDNAGLSASNIVDDGGIDTLDFSEVTSGVTINLTPGAYSSVGKNSSGSATLANLTTSFDAVIENVLGTAAADIIVGNTAVNLITGGAGDDKVDGAAGIDTLKLTSAKSAYTLTKTTTGFTIQDNAGTDGTDTFSNVERLVFSDGSQLALDLDGHAGQVAKLLAVAGGKNIVGNAALVGAGLGMLDGGMTYEGLASLVMNALGKTTAADALTLIWTNLLGTTPDAAQVDSIVASLGNPSVGALTVLAADLPINAQLIGLSDLATQGLAFS